MVKLERYKENPILEPIKEHSWESVNVSNAGAVIHEGKVFLLYRAEGEERRKSCNWPVARLGLAISKDGFNIDYRSKNPVLEAKEPYDAIEDPRITKIGDVYYIIYVLTSIYGDRIGLATTKDFVTFNDHGPIMDDISQRTSGLFPKKINGNYLLMHRILPNIWLSKTRDFRKWYDSKIILKTKFGCWDEVKIGIGAPPIETENAWVLFYHGVDSHKVYRLGIAWLDKDDPSKVIKRQDSPILEPEEDYEKNGFTPNTVYTCGAVEKDGKYIVYYGCCDSVLAAATVEKEKVVREIY